MLREIVLDTETTGLDPKRGDRLIEIGCVELINRIPSGKEYHVFINPERDVPAEAQAVHGISDADVANAPSFETIAHEVKKALEGCVPAAYNAAFDKAFLQAEMSRAKVTAQDVPAMRREVEWVDPLVWARELQSDERSRALGDVAARLGVKLENAHRASDDAEAALHVLYKLGKDARVPRAYGAFVQEQRRLAMLQADERRMWRNS